MNRTLKRRWLAVLTAIVAASYVGVGLAGQGVVRPAGVLGAVAILGSLSLARGSRNSRASRGAAVALLVLGVIPLAALTWWSVATPVLAFCGLVVGWPRAVDRPDDDAAGSPRPRRVAGAPA